MHCVYSIQWPQRAAAISSSSSSSSNESKRRQRRTQCNTNNNKVKIDSNSIELKCSTSILCWSQIITSDVWSMVCNVFVRSMCRFWNCGWLRTSWGVAYICIFRILCRNRQIAAQTHRPISLVALIPSLVCLPFRFRCVCMCVSCVVWQWVLRSFNEHIKFVRCNRTPIQLILMKCHTHITICQAGEIRKSFYWALLRAYVIVWRMHWVSLRKHKHSISRTNCG